MTEFMWGVIIGTNPPVDVKAESAMDAWRELNNTWPRLTPCRGGWLVEDRQGLPIGQVLMPPIDWLDAAVSA